MKKIIQVNWANFSNAERPYNFNSEDYLLININISDVFHNMSKEDSLSLTENNGGNNAIGNRLKNAKEHILGGQPMDYPELGYSEANYNINYTNGRHRTLACYQLGLEYIPAFVYKKILKNLKRL